jgi:MFS family permease
MRRFHSLLLPMLLPKLYCYAIYLPRPNTNNPFLLKAELNAPQDVITCEKKSTSSSPSPKPSSDISLDIPQCIPMNAGQFGLVSSIFTLGGLFGALCAGPISSHYGRLLSMRLAAILFVVGPAFEALAPSIPTISLGRLISGVGAGVAVVVVPIYISEVAPPQGKGFFGAMTQVMTNLGILITQSLGLFLSRGQLWRVILAIAGVIGLLQALGLTFVMESPKWMAANGNPTRARRNLQKIRGQGTTIEGEVDAWGIEGIQSKWTSTIRPSRRLNHGQMGHTSHSITR